MKPGARLILPGHLAPNVGEVRTDAPTAPQVAVYVIMAIVSANAWTLECFDCEAAFLNGVTALRNLFFTPPKEGPPGVPAGAILECVKGVFGLQESPRLWYMKFRGNLLLVGWQEAPFAKAVFLLYDGDDELCGVLCIHVDDGIMAGQGERYREAKDELKKKIKFGKWEKQRFKYNGKLIEQSDDGTIKMTQQEFIKNVRRRKPDSELTSTEVSSLRSGCGSLGYAARETLPLLAYGVSYLQQKVGDKPTVADLLEFNKLVKIGDKLTKDGYGIVVPKVDLKKIAVAVISDASFGKMPKGGSQAGYLIPITETGAMHEQKPACLVERGSHRIKRVVKSTLAAESAGLAEALDHGEYVRALLGSILVKTEPASSYDKQHWEKFVDRIPMIAQVDAKSLYDHVVKPGSMPGERRVALDLWAAREMFEKENATLRWTPTHEMMADMLTKQVSDVSLVEVFLQQAAWCCDYDHERQAARECRRASKKAERKNRTSKA